MTTGFRYSLHPALAPREVTLAAPAPRARVFGLNQVEEARFQAWHAGRQNKAAAAASRYEFSFQPTGIGVGCKVKCRVTGEELDLTDYDSW